MALKCHYIGGFSKQLPVMILGVAALFGNDCMHSKCLFTCRNSQTWGTPQTVTDTQAASVTWAYYVIHGVPTQLQELWVTHCCNREAVANKECNCAHASAVNSKGFVELAATIIDIVISKLEFHLILLVCWLCSPKQWTWITCTSLTEVEVCNNFM